MSRTLSVIGVLLLLVAGGLWLLKPDIPTSGSPTSIQSPVPQETMMPPIASSTPTATPMAQLITIDTPAPGTLVGSPVVITGRTAKYPVQGQLHYHIVIADQHDFTLDSGTFTVTGALHHPATFNVSLTFSTPAASNRITIELFDQDPATHALVASASTTLAIIPLSVLFPQTSGGFPAPEALPLPPMTPINAPPLLPGTPEPTIATPTAAFIPTASLTPTAAATVATPPPTPHVVIEAHHPGWMEMGASDTINLSLKHIIAEMATATSVRPDRTTVAGAPAFPGTPEAVLEQAFGPGYDAVVIAKVVAPAFEVQSTGDELSLDQDEVTWQWGITPKHTGHQLVTISVEGQWRPQAGGRSINRNLWRRDFYIDVYEPMLSRVQFELVTVIVALFGVVGSALGFIPPIQELHQLWRKRRQGTTPP